MYSPFSTVVGVVFVLLCCWSGQTLSKNIISTDVNDLRYLYYLSEEQQVEIKYDNAASLQASNIRNGTRTIVIVGGFQSNLTAGGMSANVKNAYVSLGTFNVIVLDWARLSGSDITYQDDPLPYNKVVKNVPPVGERLADFLYFLSSNKQIPFSEIHIVGHSLGAHVGGNAGKVVINKYKDLLGRISGLDPAGPLYNFQENPEVTLERTDAFFVDVYHTNRGLLGIVDDVGTVNVYVNGGGANLVVGMQTRQNFIAGNVIVCVSLDCSGYCSHTFAWKFFISAFKKDYVACPCHNFACTCTISCNDSCGDDGVIVGPNIPMSVQSLFHVKLFNIQVSAQNAELRITVDDLT